VVRRARADDRDAVLAFASSTWHGWDYIPGAWSTWLAAPDGAFLVGWCGEPGGVDAEGNELQVGQQVAITRVTMASDTDSWLEGIRVDPRVRGMEVARDLQVAELHWVAAQGATVVRYATGADNIGSHRLGARDGINLLVVFKSVWWTADKADERDLPSGFDSSVVASATALRQHVLAGLGQAGWIAGKADTTTLWEMVSADPGFNAGLRLHESRAWAMNELTADAFARHLERGEVVVTPSREAVAIVVREHLPTEDSALRPTTLVGSAGGALELLEKVRHIAGDTMRTRIPADSSLLTRDLQTFEAAGYHSPEWTMHVLGRRMDDGTPLPAVDPSRLVLAEPPDRLVPPRW